MDVEEWFQVNAFEPYVERSRWASLESRVESSTDQVLELLSDAGARGTFFTLGWVADRYPRLVRRIAEAGHEVASHGYWHQRIPEIEPSAFRDDIRRAKSALEQVSGVPVTGYRAPSFSLLRSVPWAATTLVEEGYTYDSSRFPIQRPGYGAKGALTGPHWLCTAAGPLLEIPPSVWEVLGLRIPVAGGGWLRQFPFWVIRSGFGAIAREGRTGVFYIHPWELDPNQPRITVPLLTRLRHYRGMHQTADKIRQLLGDATYITIATHIADLDAASLPRVEFAA